MNGTRADLIDEIPKCAYTGCALIGTRVYVTEGFDGDCALKSTLCYDFEIESGYKFLITSKVTKHFTTTLLGMDNSCDMYTVRAKVSCLSAIYGVWQNDQTII
ncbi:unnamed protein product [Schistosoma curassoni]|uniref:Uncharacterized protein n=1 Tax=Schistosoma curassoni TaxID=6186 RepID=A0A183KGS1_9TREM|nr:unnamed protein product [Schistosoma curassoni]